MRALNLRRCLLPESFGYNRGRRLRLCLLLNGFDRMLLPGINIGLLYRF